MSHSSYTPFQEMMMQCLSQNATRTSTRQRQSTTPTANTRQAELSENDQFIRLTVELPGVFAKDLEVDVKHGVLSIKGVRKTMSIDGSVCIKKHKFSRRYAIDTDVVDISKVKANLTQGILTIKAPKKSRPHHVRIGVTENEDTDEANLITTTVPNIPVTTERVMPNISPKVGTQFGAMHQPPAPIQSDSEV